MSLRDFNACIRALEDAEQLRQNTEAALIRKRMSRGLGVLGAWAAGDGARSEQAVLEAAARQLGAHRESVIWYLRTRLQETARTQQNMMETRLTREMEKNRSVLAKARGPALGVGPHDAANRGRVKPPPVGMPTHTAAAAPAAAVGSLELVGLTMQEEEERRPAVVESLTDDQMLMFEKGNQDMLKYFESTLDKVRYVFRLAFPPSPPPPC